MFRSRVAGSGLADLVLRISFGGFRLADFVPQISFGGSLILVDYWPLSRQQLQAIINYLAGEPTYLVGGTNPKSTTSTICVRACVRAYMRAGLVQGLVSEVVQVFFQAAVAPT